MAKLNAGRARIKQKNIALIDNAEMFSALMFIYDICSGTDHRSAPSGYKSAPSGILPRFTLLNKSPE